MFFSRTLKFHPNDKFLYCGLLLRGQSAMSKSVPVRVRAVLNMPWPQQCLAVRVRRVHKEKQGETQSSFYCGVHLQSSGASSMVFLCHGPFHLQLTTHPTRCPMPGVTASCRTEAHLRAKAGKRLRSKNSRQRAKEKFA